MLVHTAPPFPSALGLADIKRMQQLGPIAKPNSFTWVPRPNSLVPCVLAPPTDSWPAVHNPYDDVPGWPHNGEQPAGTYRGMLWLTDVYVGLGVVQEGLYTPILE